MKTLGMLLILLVAATASAQDAREYVLRVVVDSAFVRAAPSLDADPVASVFDNDSLLAVGRNIDGLWLEVRRPGRQTRLGWIARPLVSGTFEVARLPMTDLTTGVVGPEPVVDTGVAVLTFDEIELRSAPDRAAPQLAVIDVFLTLPVVERTPDRLWLKVNYRGTTGWIPEFRTSTSANLDLVPISPAYAADPKYAAFEIIPVEVQLAQIDRLVNYITPIKNTADDVAAYWQMMSEGETMECWPPAGNYPHYGYTPRDAVELPELRQQERLLIQAVDDINTSIEAMRRCGVYTLSEIRAAYADAINAQAIFELVLSRMETLRKRIAGQ